MSATVQRIRVSLVWAAIALVAIPAGISAAGAAAKHRVKKAAPRVVQQLRGVNLTPNWEWPGSAGMDDATSARELQSACSLGADLVRFTVKWNRLEPVQGRIDEAYARRIDQVLAEASSCRIKVLVTLMITPCWAAADGTPVKCPPGAGTIDPPSDPATYGSIVERMLRRWPGIYALEVWNEPNLTSFWHGTAAEYAATRERRDRGRESPRLADTDAGRLDRRRRHPLPAQALLRRNPRIRRHLDPSI